MADPKGKTVTITVDQVELDVLRNGLELARQSAVRLGNRGGQPTEIAEVYKRRVAEVTTLQMKLPVKVPQ